MARRIPTIEVPVTADIPPGNITATEWQGVNVATTVQAALRFDPAHPNYGAIRDDDSPSVRATNDAAFALAADDARISGGTLVIKGMYHLSAPLQILCNVDAASGVLRFNDLSLAPAVLVGGPTVAERLTSRTMFLPEIWQDAKTNTGWAGTDMGLEVCRANQCYITIPHIKNFSTNMAVTGASGGNSYNTYSIGILENGKINLDLFCRDAGGWVNENMFLNGRFHHNTAEGVNVAGVRHIRLQDEPNAINNNVFLKPSIEGNTAEYHVEISGPYNAFDHARWEASPPKVLFNGPSSNSNLIFYGYGTHLLQYTFINGADAKTLHHYGRNNVRLTGETRFTNADSGSNAAIAVYEPGSGMHDASSNYVARMTSITTDLKRATDAAPRVSIDHRNAGIYFGNGVAAPTAGITGYGVAGLRFNGNFFGFYGATPVTKPTVTGSKGGNAALESLLTALADLGLITDSTTA